MLRSNYVILDFETTGLNHNKEQITQASLICVDPYTFATKSSLNLYVKLENGRTLTDFIKNLTGFTEEFLNEKGFSEGEVVAAVRDFIKNSGEGLEPIVVAHHAAFDFAFLANYGVYPREFICTRTLARILEPNEKASLKDVATRHGFYDEKGHHDARNDIEMTRRIIEKFVPLAERKGYNYRNMVIDSKERPLSFIPAYGQVIRY